MIYCYLWSFMYISNYYWTYFSQTVHVWWSSAIVKYKYRRQHWSLAGTRSPHQSVSHLLMLFLYKILICSTAESLIYYYLYLYIYILIYILILIISGWTRVLYSTEVKLFPWIPEFVVNFLTKTALLEVYIVCMYTRLEV
jgi:hypothetical protein